MAKSYNIDRLTREDIFGGRLITPMRQRLKKQGVDTKHYDYNADMAIITHYLQNQGLPEAEMYADALPLMEQYYRATHTDLLEDAPVDQNAVLDLFAAAQEGAPCQRFRDNRSFTFIDLFAGIGGFRIALEQLGGRCVYASEFDITAQKNYGMNHGVVPFGDIKKQENKNRIPAEIDVLCAGFPCQPFSLAGLRKGFSDETKGTLFFDLREIIETKHPRVIFLENVPGLLSIYNRDENGNRLEEKTIDTILRILREDLHYHVHKPEIVNAKNFGVPQNRDRVFIVGFRDEDLGDYQLPLQNDNADTHFGDIREYNVDTGYFMSERYWQTLLRHKEEQKNKGRGYGYRIIDNDDFGHTLMVGGMGLERNLVVDEEHVDFEQLNDPRGELNHDNIRVLTERECARMQGFPEYFEIKVGKSPAYNQFGNSVAVPAIKSVALSLLEHANINHIVLE